MISSSDTPCAPSSLSPAPALLGQAGSVGPYQPLVEAGDALRADDGAGGGGEAAVDAGLAGGGEVGGHARAGRSSGKVASIVAPPDSAPAPICRERQRLRRVVAGGDELAEAAEEREAQRVGRDDARAVRGVAAPEGGQPAPRDPRQRVQHPGEAPVAAGRQPRAGRSPDLDAPKGATAVFAMAEAAPPDASWPPSSRASSDITPPPHLSSLFPFHRSTNTAQHRLAADSRDRHAPTTAPGTTYVQRRRPPIDVGRAPSRPAWGGAATRPWPCTRLCVAHLEPAVSQPFRPPPSDTAHQESTLQLGGVAAAGGRAQDGEARALRAPTASGPPSSPRAPRCSRGCSGSPPRSRCPRLGRAAAAASGRLPRRRARPPPPLHRGPLAPPPPARLRRRRCNGVRLPRRRSACGSRRSRTSARRASAPARGGARSSRSRRPAASAVPGRRLLPYPRQCVAYRADEPPVVDSDLSEPAWAEVSWTEAEDISNPNPGRGPPIPPLHAAKMRWTTSSSTSAFLEIRTSGRRSGAELNNLRGPRLSAASAPLASATRRCLPTLRPQTGVCAHVSTAVEVFVDPAGCNHEYKEFEMNAQHDGLLLNRPYGDGGEVRAASTRRTAGRCCRRSAAHVNGPIKPEHAEWRLVSGDRMPVAQLQERQKAAGCGAATPRPRHALARRLQPRQLARDRGGRAVRQDPERPHEDNWVWSPQGIVAMRAKPGLLQFSSELSTRRAAFEPEWPVGRWRWGSTAQRLYMEQHGALTARRNAATGSVRRGEDVAWLLRTDGRRVDAEGWNSPRADDGTRMAGADATTAVRQRTCSAASAEGVCLAGAACGGGERPRRGCRRPSQPAAAHRGGATGQHDCLGAMMPIDGQRCCNLGDGCDVLRRMSTILRIWGCLPGGGVLAGRGRGGRGRP